MFSSSALGRYTPPTCTLEIFPTSSPRWKKRKPTKELRFKLSFDDPRLPEEQQVTIEGDRAQLNQLSEAVGDYVIKFLSRTSTIPLILETSPSKKSIEEDGIKDNTPFLKPRGLFTHQLFFGALANEQSGSVIDLSVSQLFDLANAVDDYNSEIATVKNSSRKRVPFWGATAAAALLVIGLTGVGIKLYQSKREANSVATRIESDTTGDRPKISDVIPPSAPKDNTVPSPTPSQPLASGKKLPPPPPVDAPKPLADIPTPPPLVQTPSIPTPPNPVPPPPERETIALNPNSETASEDNVDKPPPTTSVVPNPTNLTPNSQNTPTNRTTLPSLPPLQPESPTPQLTPKDSSVAVAPAGNPKTSLNKIPQLAEAKEYFQKKWQPPEGLSQTLEYRIALNNDGSIGRITPIGKASEVYLDRTGMPLMGESFVSPLSTNSQIRLVLSPDGTVRTFME